MKKTIKQLQREISLFEEFISLEEDPAPPQNATWARLEAPGLCRVLSKEEILQEYGEPPHILR